MVVHAADIQDREGAWWVLAALPAIWRTIQKLWVDQGYTGTLPHAVEAEYGIEVWVVQRTAPKGTWELLPRRWVVERTFAWLGRSRRLSKDYEHLSENSESWVYLASVAFLLKRLKPDPTRERPYARKAA